MTAIDRLPPMTDEQMRERLGRPASFTLESRAYVLGLLRRSEAATDDTDPGLVWEHVRRMLALMEEGTLVVLLAGTAAGDPDWGGLGVFDADPDEVRTILEADPLVLAGLCRVEIHPAVGFPGVPPVT